MKHIAKHLTLFLFMFASAIGAAAKDMKFILPDVPPAQQWEYIGNLMREAQSCMDNYDYSAAQTLLTERCALLDLYYATHGTASADAQQTGYEYRMLVPKLYCNLRMGQIESNLQEIAHLREQYQTLFNTRHPQDDLLETEVAETYFRMGNIGMAIETAENMLERLRNDDDRSSVAYNKMYYRLKAYYQSIGRHGKISYSAMQYPPENGISELSDFYDSLSDDEQTFEQKMTTLVETAAGLMAAYDNRDAKEIVEVGLWILDQEFPEEARQQDVETNRRYSLLKCNLLTMLSRANKYSLFANTAVEEYLLETYRMKRQLFGETSTEVADAAEALGDYYYEKKNDLDLAIESYEEAHAILKNTSEFRGGQLIDVLGELMRCYADIDDPQLVAEVVKELIAATKDMIVAGFAVCSGAERAALWDKYDHWLLDDIPKMALRFEGRLELGAELYDIALFGKGLLMMSDNAMTELVKKKGSAELKQEGARLHELRLRLHEQLTSSEFADRLGAQETRREIEEVEHRLLAQVNRLGDWQHGLNFGWRDIQKQLKNGETAIEFIECKERPWEDRGTIIAIVLSADSYCPIMRKFCDSDDLTYSATFEHCRDTRFFENHWRNLESDLGFTTTIFFSPAGVLNTIPMEYCPVDAESTLFDKYNMYRLTSTRKILERAKSQPIKSAYVYGGIDYTPDLNELKAANVALMGEGEIPEGTGGLSKDMTFDTSCYYSNNIQNQTSWMDVYQEMLSSSALLSDFLSLMGCDVHFFHDYRATEECFKSMSRKPIDVLIIGTHGFTFNSSTTDATKYSFTYKRDYNPVSESEMAMTLSGLLLSGASMAYSPDCSREGLEDGIITAAEIAQLNLQSVQLVHLSACKTGLGEITPEGVLGLQRGFKRAGAKALINALAPAYTFYVTYFDTTFYRELFYDKSGKRRKTQSIHDAFYASVRKVREIYKDPKYWGVNVLIDALD